MKRTKRQKRGTAARAHAACAAQAQAKRDSNAALATLRRLEAQRRQAHEARSARKYAARQEVCEFARCANAQLAQLRAERLSKLPTTPDFTLRYAGSFGHGARRNDLPRRVGTYDTVVYGEVTKYDHSCPLRPGDSVTTRSGKRAVVISRYFDRGNGHTLGELRLECVLAHQMGL